MHPSAPSQERVTEVREAARDLPREAGAAWFSALGGDAPAQPQVREISQILDHFARVC